MPTGNTSSPALRTSTVMSRADSHERFDADVRA